MRQKVEKKVVKAMFRQLDALQRKHGSMESRYVITRWLNGQRDKSRLAKQRAALERELAEVTRRLG